MPCSLIYRILFVKSASKTIRLLLDIRPDDSESYIGIALGPIS